MLLNIWFVSLTSVSFLSLSILNSFIFFSFFWLKTGVPGAFFGRNEYVLSLPIYSSFSSLSLYSYSIFKLLLLLFSVIISLIVFCSLFKGRFSDLILFSFFSTFILFSNFSFSFSFSSGILFIEILLFNKLSKLKLFEGFSSSLFLVISLFIFSLKALFLSLFSKFILFSSDTLIRFSNVSILKYFFKLKIKNNLNNNNYILKIK